MTLCQQVISQVFAQLWHEYRQTVTEVSAIEDLLRGTGAAWIEDHVALRTLPGEFCNAKVLQAVFESLGYTRQEDLFFADKQLRAFWMRPPLCDELANLEIGPKIFISELIPDQFSAEFQAVLQKYTATVTTTPIETLEHWQARIVAGDEDAVAPMVNLVVAFLQGRLWQTPTKYDYDLLRHESEYAAWTLVFGQRVNHFTLSVHLMEQFASLAAFQGYISEHLQVSLNTSGGVIKGSAQVGLEQFSTLATQVPVLFQDGLRLLPYAFVEFAFRHPLPGQVADQRWRSYYQGFVVNNADRIFESTHTR